MSSYLLNHDFLPILLWLVFTGLVL